MSQLGITPSMAWTSTGNDRQHDLGWTCAIQVDRVVGGDDPGVPADRLARVRVQVEAREVAARDVDPDSVASLEEVARRRQRYPCLVNLTRLHQFLMFPAVAIADADDGIDDVHMVPAGVILVRRVDV